MPNHRNTPQRHRRGRANREQRNAVLSAWRHINPEYSDVIYGAVHEAGQDIDLGFSLFKRIPHSHRAFILDPRRMRGRLARGYEPGFNLRNVADQIQDTSQTSIEGSIREPLMRRSKHLLAPVKSTELDEEIRGAKRLLAEEGARGFNDPKVQRSAGAMIYLGQIDERIREIPKGERLEIARTVIDGIDMMLTQSSLDMNHVPFGEMRVKISRT
jgi:hypothetical protein